VPGSVLIVGITPGITARTQLRAASKLANAIHADAGRVRAVVRRRSLRYIALIEGKCCDKF